MIHRLTKLSWDWGIRCFGVEHMMNVPIRSLRLGEEAIELMQACKVSRDLAHKLVDTVYGRPVGQVSQELGGVLLTAGVLCEAMNLDLEEVLFTELSRCLEKDPSVFRQRNQDKLDLGLNVGDKK